MGRIANGSLAILASSHNKGAGKCARMSCAILATRSSLETPPAAGPVRGWMDSTVPSSRSLSCTERMHGDDCWFGTQQLSPELVDQQRHAQVSSWSKTSCCSGSHEVVSGLIGGTR